MIRSFAIRATTLAVALSTLARVESAHARPRPDNDNFFFATEILEPLFADKQQTFGATTEIGDPTTCSGNSSSVWYAYTPEVDELVRADTFGSKYDTTLSVYVGELLDELDEVACNDDAVDSQSELAFEATAGVTYFFMVAAFSGEQGGFMRFHFEVIADDMAAG
ncbi:hypothetical protein [Nannocystis radixulma]|uniref:Uncharacterized protein n=1 Tax=Nannocystis radixulma TaxID=2995305 RepID=A0ABT5B3V7_9BACT|nr:hypothetical protein [Nannocystis radixulma]MDC0668792.1 hypothetical protein [Nannocystis radixulma]